ncbi:MAG: DoxX family membrane protein [Propionibacteriales bacterium]|nr:DoxX family membrane protein [Propionibacteriales bacterium]
MDFVVLIGRILFVFVFLGSGMAHLTQTEGMAGYAQSKGVPFAKPTVLGSGALIIVGALMVLLGIWGDLGALFIVLFLVPTALMMHNFWQETDAQAKQLEMIQFMKDIGLAGGALTMFALYAEGQVGWAITDPLF